MKLYECPACHRKDIDVLNGSARNHRRSAARGAPWCGGGGLPTGLLKEVGDDGAGAVSAVLRAPGVGN